MSMSFEAEGLPETVAAPVTYHPATNKIACVYAYFEKNAQYKSNLEYFLEHGILDVVDYYVVVNGNSTVSFSPRKNLTVFHRENTGFDFGAYGAALVKHGNLSDYDFVFFLNTSVCGPYFPAGADWTRPFLEMFEKDPSVKLVGTSINVLTQAIPFLLPKDASNPLHPHVQSMFFVLDREALAFLCSQDFFLSAKHMNFLEVIAKLEVGMSFLILENGWNINCLLPGYRGLDYRGISHQPNPAAARTAGDPYYRGTYFGKTIVPSDVIFYKNTRIMQVSSTVLGTYIVTFPDPSIDHAFGDALCCKLRLDEANVSRASYFSDYDAHKLELVLVHASADPKEVLATAVSTLLSEVSEILNEIDTKV